MSEKYSNQTFSSQNFIVSTYVERNYFGFIHECVEKNA